MTRTKIPWVATRLPNGATRQGYTFNPWWGCVPVSTGCQICYAETFANRFGKWWGPWADRRFFDEKYWSNPPKWNKKAGKEGIREKVFPSMCDPFEDNPTLVEPRGQLGRLIEVTPNLDWMLLTKRIENAEEMLRDDFGFWGSLGAMGGYHRKWLDLPENVWLGTSLENQKVADKRLPVLLSTPARNRFLSCEPLLGPINLGLLGTCDDWQPAYEKLSWVIVGGESGHGARPMHPDWPRALRDECNEAGIPFFFKQHGAWKPLHPQYGNTDSFDLFDDLENHPNRNHDAKETICIGNDGTIYSRWKNGKEEYFCGYQPPPATNPWWMGRIGNKEDDATLDGIVCQQFPEDEIE